MKVIKMSQVPEVDGSSPLFTGAVTRQPLVTEDMGHSFNMSNINFGRGVRNKFHTHTSDQVLVITAGTGIVATEHEELTVRVGDLIFISAGEKHWHGATKETTFSHISLTAHGSRSQQLEP
ncbi:MAG: cupin domain-containing protein [Dehalococcoidia bacterium]|nr:cupin domain-containing protein [Dehalococcoidia bacterium]